MDRVDINKVQYIGLILQKLWAGPLRSQSVPTNTPVPAQCGAAINELEGDEISYSWDLIVIP